MLFVVDVTLKTNSSASLCVIITSYMWFLWRERPSENCELVHLMISSRIITLSLCEK